MTGANYQKHFKVIGKLAKLYDDAGADNTALLALFATTYDQVATGLAADLDALEILNQYTSRYRNAISNGAQALQTLAKNIATAYLQSDYFVDDLTTEPASRSIAVVVAALATDMSAAVDNVTLGTETTTGLVNFLDEVAGAEQTWNTEADATADYRDAIYVVSAVV